MLVIVTDVSDERRSNQLIQFSCPCLTKPRTAVGQHGARRRPLVRHASVLGVDTSE